MNGILLSNLTILCDYTEELSIDEAVMELDYTGVVKFGQQFGFVHGVHCLVWL